MSKWFYKAQEEIKQRLKDLDYRWIEQIITKDDIFEKCVIWGDNPRVILFQIKRVDYGEGYIIHEYNGV